MDITDLNNIEENEMTQHTDNNTMIKTSARESSSLVKNFSSLMIIDENLTYTGDSSTRQETSSSIFNQGKAKTFFDKIRAKYGYESSSVIRDNNRIGFRKRQRENPYSIDRTEKKPRLNKKVKKRNKKHKNIKQVREYKSSSSSDIEFNTLPLSHREESINKSPLLVFNEVSNSVTTNCVRRRKFRRGKRRHKSKKNTSSSESRIEHDEFESANTPDTDSDDVVNKSRAFYRHLEIGNVSSPPTNTLKLHHFYLTSNTDNEHETS